MIRYDGRRVDLHIEELAGVHERAPEWRDEKEDEENGCVLSGSIGSS